jgi:hypothetical protein
MVVMDDRGCSGRSTGRLSGERLCASGLRSPWGAGLGLLRATLDPERVRELFREILT